MVQAAAAGAEHDGYDGHGQPAEQGHEAHDDSSAEHAGHAAGGGGAAGGGAAGSLYKSFGELLGLGSGLIEDGDYAAAVELLQAAVDGAGGPSFPLVASKR